MTTGDEGASGLDWEKVTEVRYGVAEELMAMSEAYDAEREQFPVLTRDLRLNERGGLFRWLHTLEIVSLERAEPFLATVGLPGLDPAMLRAVAQEALEAIYVLEQPDDTPLEAFVVVLEAALDRLEAELGPDAAERFFAYCASDAPYFGAEQRREDDWHTLFGKLVFGHSARYPLVKPDLSPRALAAVRRAVREHIDPDLDVRTTEADELPRLEWDEVIYDRYGDDGSPMDSVWSTGCYYETHAAWRAIEATLSPDEMDDLVEWGRRQAAVISAMRPECIAPPPTPRRPSRSEIRTRRPGVDS